MYGSTFVLSFLDFFFPFLFFSFLSLNQTKSMLRSFRTTRRKAMGEKERSVSFYESPSYEESGRSIQTHSIENTTFNYKQKERKKTDSSKGIVGGLGIYLYR